MITFVTSIKNINIPLIENVIQRINNRIVNSGSYPKYFIELFINFEKLSVPTVSFIEILTSGIIIPNPTNSIIELINESIIRKNNPTLDF